MMVRYKVRRRLTKSCSVMSVTVTGPAGASASSSPSSSSSASPPSSSSSSPSSPSPPKISFLIDSHSNSLSAKLGSKWKTSSPSSLSNSSSNPTREGDTKRFKRGMQMRDCERGIINGDINDRYKKGLQKRLYKRV